MIDHKELGLTCVATTIKELEAQITDMQWEGMAPEAMQQHLLELKSLKRMQSLGELYIPNF